MFSHLHLLLHIHFWDRFPQLQYVPSCLGKIYMFWEMVIVSDLE